MTIDIPDSLGRLMYDDNVTEYTKILLDIFAKKAHTHSQSDITGLETALAGFLKESDLNARIEFIDYGEINGDDLPYDSATKSYYYSLPISLEIGATKIVTVKLSSEDGISNGTHFGLRLPSGGVYLVWGIIKRVSSYFGNNPEASGYPYSYGPDLIEGQAIIQESKVTEYYYVHNDEFILFITRVS